MTPKITSEVSLGNLLHLVGTAALLIAGYVSMQDRVNTLESSFTDVRKATTRMEHYLSSRDQNYYKRTHQNGDATDGDQ